MKYKCDKEMRTMMRESGHLDSFAWPGGYPIIYVDEKNGDILCAKCAEEDLREANMLWAKGPLFHDIFFEGPSEYCANCNAEIESAYGDPEADA